MAIALYPEENKTCFLKTIALHVSAKRFLLLSIGCAVLNLAQSQGDKRLAEADHYFAAGEYYTAASLYGQVLNPSTRQKSPSGFPLNSKRNGQGALSGYISKLDIEYKQAESYRLANYLAQSSALYKHCFEKDPVKYASALYWYAVCQRSIGNYEAAEESINQFLTAKAAEAYQQGAENQKDILRFVKTQLVRPDSVLYQVKKMAASFETEKGVFAVAAVAGNKFMLTSTQTDSATQPGNNPNHNRLFYAIRNGESLQNIEPVPLEGINSSINQGAASLSADGNYLYFTQWKKEKDHTLASIYYAKKNKGVWSQPMSLPSANLEGYNSKQPYCSADGKYLFFASDRAGGMGGFDIWYALLQADGTIGEPINTGAIINTPDNEQAPFYHLGTHTLVFASDRVPGMGGFDLFSSSGKEITWKRPENMGYPVNSARDDVYFYAAQDGALLTDAIISSDRGSECCFASYAVTKMAKKKVITGAVRDCKDNMPVTDAEVLLKDASGKTSSAITNAEGKYRFELNSEAAGQLSIRKEKYKEKTTDVVVEGSNEKDWLVDTLYNTAVCLEKKLVIKVENVVTVYFDFDQSYLKERGVAVLDSIYNVLVENPSATIQISGYTDGRGTVEYNKVLSDKRARTCADYLIKKGIDTARVSFESFGACCPVEMELINGRDNPDGRSMNRRALINISKD